MRIIIPAESNHVVADWVSRGFYGILLRGGVRLFLYQDAMVHAKTATIDGQWSTIGTANIDRLSLHGNYEINAEIYNEAVAQQMETIFEVDSSNTVEMTWETLARPAPAGQGQRDGADPVPAPPLALGRPVRLVAQDRAPARSAPCPLALRVRCGRSCAGRDSSDAAETFSSAVAPALRRWRWVAT